MTKLQNLRKILEAGTAGPIVIQKDRRTITVGPHVLCKTDAPYPRCFQDAVLIKKMHNHFEALLDVAEAAKEYQDTNVGYMKNLKSNFLIQRDVDEMDFNMKRIAARVFEALRKLEVVE